MHDTAWHLAMPQGYLVQREMGNIDRWRSDINISNISQELGFASRSVLQSICVAFNRLFSLALQSQQNPGRLSQR